MQTWIQSPHPPYPIAQTINDRHWHCRPSQHSHAREAPFVAKIPPVPPTRLCKDEHAIAKQSMLFISVMADSPHWSCIAAYNVIAMTVSVANAAIFIATFPLVLPRRAPGGPTEWKLKNAREGWHCTRRRHRRRHRDIAQTINGNRGHLYATSTARCQHMINWPLQPRRLYAQHREVSNCLSAAMATSNDGGYSHLIININWSHDTYLILVRHFIQFPIIWMNLASKYFRFCLE